jgi:hypothetical protein
MFKLNLIKSKKTLIIGSLILILSLIIGVSGYFVYQENLKEAEKQTWRYWEKGDERRGGLVIQNSIKRNAKREYVLTKFDYQKPVTTVVMLYETLADNRQDIYFETFYLERTGINSFKVNESIVSNSANYTFNEAVELAKKYDVYRENPAKDKISNRPDLNVSQQYLNLQQKRLEVYQNPEYRKLEDACRETLRQDLDNNKYFKCSDDAKKQFGIYE